MNNKKLFLIKKTDYFYGKNNGIFVDKCITEYIIFSFLRIFDIEVLTLN